MSYRHSHIRHVRGKSVRVRGHSTHRRNATKGIKTTERSNMESSGLVAYCICKSTGAVYTA